jgi:lysophospholipase L1-like esterase
MILPAHAQLNLAGPTTRAVFQRDDANQASVPLKGTYGSSPLTIEARATGEGGVPITSWQVIDASPTGGNFAGSLTLPAGGWYDIEVRGLAGMTETGSASVDRVGVGDVFVTAGQSNAANHGTPRQTADDRVSALVSWSTGQWRQANDPQPIASGSDGSPWPAFGNAMVVQNDMPIGIISVANGGTTVGNWLPGDTLYGRLRDALQYLGPHGAKAVLWHQGESDAIEGTSTATYASRLSTIIAQSRIDAGWDVPWGVAIASYHNTPTLEQRAQVVAGQHQVIDNDPLVFQGPDTDDFHNIGYLWDNVHFNALGLQAHGRMWADAVASFFEPIPEPTSATLLALGSPIAFSFAIRRRSK